MKLLARSMVLAVLLVAAPAYAGGAFESCYPSEEARAGTVESVREVAVVRDMHAFDPEVLEHRLRAETIELLTVRLDAGPLVVLDQGAGQRMRAGQRVLVTQDGAAACLVPLGQQVPLAALAQRLF
jgi:outer membrane lipoprotein SlyB